MADTERVVMNWPKELKSQVREVAGERGITEFTLAAVNQHLGNASNLGQLEIELAEMQHFAQLLADQLVLGGSTEDRLQFLMELEFPDWITTEGWPEAYAERVRPHKEARAAINAGEFDKRLEEGQPVEVTVVPAKPIPEPEPEPEPAPPNSATNVTAPASTNLTTATGGSDLLERLKAAGKLVVAADLPTPESKPEPEPEPAPAPELPEAPEAAPEEAVPAAADPAKCPNCKEELIDGECWTCAF